MKKKILLMLIPMMLLMMTAIPMVFAFPTDLNLNWTGGTIDATFISGDDAIARMHAEGNTYGTFYAVDTDNLGLYGVDDSSSWMDSYITGGGMLEFEYTRTDTGEAFYGAPGQNSYSQVSSSGTGILDFSVSSNYAYMKSYTYPTAFTAFQATGENFYITHKLTSSLADNFGALEVFGDGSASVTHSYDRSGYTGDSFSFGAGTGGCVWGTSITTTGDGIAAVWGHGDDYLRDGTYGQSSDWEMPNGGSFGAMWTYSDGITVTDYGFYGN